MFFAHDARDDVITDFTDTDRIDLSAIDLHLVGSFTGQSRELLIQDTAYGARILADLDGDRLADFSLTVSGAVDYGRATYVEALIL